MFSVPMSNASKSRYRSRRAVRRPMELSTHIVTNWTKAKIAFVCCGIGTIAMTTIMPILMLGSTMSSNPASQGTTQVHVSLHNLIHKSIEVEQEYKNRGKNLVKEANHKMQEVLHVDKPDKSLGQEEAPTKSVKTTGPQNTTISLNYRNENVPVKNLTNGKERQIRKEPKKLVVSKKANETNELAPPETPKKSKKLKLEQADTNSTSNTAVKRKQLARGVSGLPMSITPALVGARPGHIECDVDVDNLVYWNDPQGDLDREFVSPFATSQPRYLTFEPDMGGWNNIRMSMEIIFVLAAATGRILVLPPKSPFYLLGQGKENARSFGNFFPLEHPDFARQVKIMTMEDFVEKEKNGILNFTADEHERIKPAADVCVHTSNSPINCEVLYEPLRKVGFQPDMEGMKSCIIFDRDHFEGKNISTDVQQRAERFCGKTRISHYYNDSLHLPPLIHWNAGDHKHRLLNHFYTFLYFTDPKIDNYYKRFVRDFLHYKDNIYCAAGKVVNALNAEGKSWSSLHVRRGDLQFKAVKIPAEEWYNNTYEIWEKDEILFIATDERNKTFFDPIKKYHELRFLDDYWEVAQLGDLESTYLGMVDTIVASHGRAFAGTWFSTFTGYINRMRGYLGHSMNNSWYSWLPRKDVMQQWKYPEGNMPAREWPLGWVAIDGDVWIEHEGEPVLESIEQQQ